MKKKEIEEVVEEVVEVVEEVTDTTQEQARLDMLVALQTKLNEEGITRMSGLALAIEKATTALKAVK